MLINKVELNYNELAAIFGEDGLQNIPADFKCKGISIDSREIEQGNVFIALKGENIDGHTKAREAIDKGAAAVVVENEWYDKHSDELKDSRAIIVNDSLKAIGEIARFHRMRFNIPLVAVGGSNGKTTTKDMTAHILSQKYNVLRTHANYNNRLGVPLMLLQLDESIDIAVIEIATNEPGEIAVLSEITSPTHGIITNIGEEHLEKLIDLAGVEMEETFLFGHLKKNDGMAFINMDDPVLKRYDMVLDNKVKYGTGDDVDIKAEFDKGEGIYYRINIKHESGEITAEMKAAGYHSAFNGLAAASIAINLGLDGDMIKEGLESLKVAGGGGYARTLIEIAGGLTIINDCYNANPSSMAASLSTLEDYPADGKRIAVIGDMLELGDASSEAHASILRKASGIADIVFTFGNRMSTANQESGLKNVHSFTDKKTLFEALSQQTGKGDVLLVKGSRGMKMETVISDVKSGFSE